MTTDLSRISPKMAPNVAQDVAQDSHRDAPGTSRGAATARSPASGFARPRSGRTLASAHDALRTGDRIFIENVYPEIDGGRFPVKRAVGDAFEVWADIFRDGHDVLAADILFRPAGTQEWQRAPMRHHDNDRWTGELFLTRNTRLEYTVEAWTDVFGSWRRDLLKKLAAAQPVELELVEGREIFARACDTASGESAQQLRDFVTTAATSAPTGEHPLLSGECQTLMAQHGPRDDVSRYKTLEVTVDRTAAVSAAWYEIFPRAQGTDPAKSATFDDCIRRLPDIRAMGFDVLYLTPIHPIGRVNRKGPNNTLNPGPNDPGSPYAIGSHEGGHDAIHPELGTVDDFLRLESACRAHDMEIALDFAIQCAPDHPWVKDHPEWFTVRPDGSIKYAENPPKKYQDIVNVNFYGPHRDALWNALRDVLLLWSERGVRIFRVDNPHTKPLPFWEWVIREVQSRYPDVIFLSEAFTRPKVMKALAKAGFTQSYTYFTWRNHKQELTDYLNELTQTECREYMRPNFFANTPDILPAFLQSSNPAAFKIRFALASTLAGVYGIYSGFELCDGHGVAGTEDYQDSEKYQIRVRDWDSPGNIKPFVTAINQMRRDHPALRDFLGLNFWRADNGNVLFYSKMTAALDDTVFVAVNLDPDHAQDVDVWFPISEMGLSDNDAYEAEDLFTGAKHLWRGSLQHLRLDPATNPVAIFRIALWKQVDYRTTGR